MRLQDLKSEEAYALASEYLSGLSNAGVTILSATQQDIYNGLYFYAVIQDALFEMRHNGDGREQKRAISTMNHWTPIVRKCSHVVNQWLELGQPLDEELDWT